MITVDIAGGDLKAATWCDNQNRLSPDCAQLKLNPVICTRNVALSDLNAS
jgi:hypothetical protein